MKNFITVTPARYISGPSQDGKMLFGKYLPESIAIRQIVMTRLVHGSDSACVDHEPQSVSLLELVGRDDPLFFVGTPEDIDRLITEATSGSVSGWRPAENPPKDGWTGLAWDGEYHWILWRESGTWSEAEGRTVYPTHWMPFPEPPTEAQS